MFSVGHVYTRDEIGNQVGGSKQTYLPTCGGMVVAACLTKDLNPLAPRVILCGTPPMVARAGDILARQTEAIPVFVKLDVNRWEYHGHFRPKASYTSGLEFERLVDGSGRARSDVTRAVVLEPITAA
ncbi:DUF6697 family protein [Methylibium petroleiphilum]|uniref:DUF6697 domain-containing protein n=1 Tax=Methylibium petroleiphilum (strain ATCC BAA-1232 / LMG 22953 / PM1) TaxID=420662 RepID=A2SMK4_METPP|nr:DUF6697 family protein [Methylibium petroleiphilum]ABM96793.1 conserved hypothetical protein [Methylibium petroleiphilum PM1]